MLRLTGVTLAGIVLLLSVPAAAQHEIQQLTRLLLDRIMGSESASAP